MKNLTELIETLKELGVINHYTEFFNNYCCGDPLRDRNAINTAKLAGDIIMAVAELETQILRNMYEVSLYADGYEEQ